jgi:hypothetical protein
VPEHAFGEVAATGVSRAEDEDGGFLRGHRSGWKKTGSACAGQRIGDRRGNAAEAGRVAA